MICPTPTDRSLSRWTRSKPNCPVVADRGIAYNTRSRARDLGLTLLFVKRLAESGEGELQALEGDAYDNTEKSQPAEDT